MTAKSEKGVYSEFTVIIPCYNEYAIKKKDSSATVAEDGDIADIFDDIEEFVSHRSKIDYSPNIVKKRKVLGHEPD